MLKLFPVISKAQMDADASAGRIYKGELYYIQDIQRIAFGDSSSEYTVFFNWDDVITHTMHGPQPGGDMHATASASNHGFMSKEDYKALYSLIEAFDTHTHELDASNIVSGVLSLDRIPPAAVERIKVVENTAKRFELTQENVQKGDSVKEADTGVMYMVVDDSNLDNESGYLQYVSGKALSVDWDGVENTPEYYPPEEHSLASHSAVNLEQLNDTIIDANLIDTGDSRLSDNRTPVVHGDDKHSEEYIKEDDPRLSDNRTPTAHTIGGSSHQESTLHQLNSKISDAELIPSTDSRLSDDRTPLSHDNSKHSVAYQASSEKAQANGYAPLDSNSNVPTGHLPESVVYSTKVVADETIRLAMTGLHPGRQAFELDTGLTYIWTGEEWILNQIVGGGSLTWDHITDKPTEFTPTAHGHSWADISDKPTLLTLGTGETNAYRADRALIAYNHSQSAHAPSDANNYSHPSDGGGSRSGLSGATVIRGITVNDAGHVTGTTTRNMTYGDVGAASVSHSHHITDVLREDGVYVTPTSWTKSAVWKFTKQSELDNPPGSGTWAQVLTVQGWSQHSTSYPSYQLCLRNGAVAVRQSTGNATWGPWRTLAEGGGSVIKKVQRGVVTSGSVGDNNHLNISIAAVNINKSFVNLSALQFVAEYRYFDFAAIMARLTSSTNLRFSAHTIEHYEDSWKFEAAPVAWEVVEFY